MVRRDATSATSEMPSNVMLKGSYKRSKRAMFMSSYELSVSQLVLTFSVKEVLPREKLKTPISATIGGSAMYLYFALRPVLKFKSRITA